MKMSYACFRAVYQRRGIIFAFSCAVFITLQDLFVKLSLGSSTAFQVTTVRSLILCMCSVVTIVVSPNGRYLVPETKDHFRLLIVRALFASASTLLNILAFSLADMGSVTAIFNSMPMFSGIIGWIVLREPFTLAELVLSFLSLTGVFLVAQPPVIFDSEATKSDTHFAGTIVALAAAVVTAVSFVLSRRLSQQQVHPIVNMLYFASVCAITTPILTTILQGWAIPQCGLERLYLILVGVFNFIVQSLLIKSLELEKPVTVTVTLTLNIFLAFLAQLLLLHEAFDVIAAAGAGVILVSSIGIALAKWKSEMRNSGNTATGSATDTGTSGTSNSNQVKAIQIF